MVYSCGHLNYCVPMQATQFSMKNMLSACILSRKATNRATEFRLLAKHRVCVSQGWGTEGLHPSLRSQVVICFLRNTVIDNLEKKYDHLGPIALKGMPGPHCPL